MLSLIEEWCSDMPYDIIAEMVYLVNEAVVLGHGMHTSAQDAGNWK